MGSAKIEEYLADRLDEIVPLGHQSVVFFQFTCSWNASGMLTRRGISVDAATGWVDAWSRRGRRSPSGDAVFLISLKAGGCGVDPHRGGPHPVMDLVEILHAEEQAIDRAHRIGQTRRLMSANGCD